MAYRAYKSVKFKPASEQRLAQCLEIIRAFQADGYRMTLRQLYYQLVGEALIPNDQKEYRKLGELIKNARLSGLIDWDAIEDRNRSPQRPPEFASLEDLVEAAINSYRLPRREGQDVYVELWCEKAALEGILAPLARRFHSVYLSNRGYGSQTATMESAKRIDRASRGLYGELEVEKAVILYVGDLDPSGEDMVRDVQERLDLFLGGSLPDVDEELDEVNENSMSPWGFDLEDVEPVWLEVRKVALDIDQVRRLNLPPNPAKRTDSRAKDFIAKFGAGSWELDALPPNELVRLVTEAFEGLYDMNLMAPIIEQENQDKARLRALYERMES